MLLTGELINFATISFITILIIDFAIIEFALRLGVFSIGSKWTKIICLLGLYLHELVEFLFIAFGEKDYIYYSLLPFFWPVWNVSYYYMLIEQNTYWMSKTIQRKLLAVWGLYIAMCVIICSMFFLLSIFVLPLTYISYVSVLNSILIAILSLTELFISIKIYRLSKEKVMRVSSKLWNKVKVSISICLLGIVIDILIFSLENIGLEDISYLIKPCTFAFKVIFECLCFQFIKGIVVGIEQSE